MATGRKLKMKAEKIAYLANPEWIRDRYVDKKWTMQMIYRYLGCSRNTLIRRMDTYGIERRKTK